MPGNSNAIATIYDVTGRKVEQHNLYGHYTNLRVSTTSYKPGLYIVTVTCKNASESKRVMIE
ncbi:MAG: T9SS type A sorting domain-containing protein [Bacteroidetes bacterium]|nr:T9SS type A sorting domain-containing protein [Bacteroidota bacterium]